MGDDEVELRELGKAPARPVGTAPPCDGPSPASRTDTREPGAVGLRLSRLQEHLPQPDARADPAEVRAPGPENGLKPKSLAVTSPHPVALVSCRSQPMSRQLSGFAFGPRSCLRGLLWPQPQFAGRLMWRARPLVATALSSCWAKAAWAKSGRPTTRQSTGSWR